MLEAQLINWLNVYDFRCTFARKKKEDFFSMTFVVFSHNGEQMLDY